MLRVLNRPDGQLVLSSPWPALWATRAWLILAVICGISVGFEDPIAGGLVAAAIFVVFGGLDSLWTWVKLGSNSILVASDSVVFHQRFGRDVRVPLDPNRTLRAAGCGGLLPLFSPAYADFAEVMVSGTYKSMTFLAFTEKQVVELETTLQELVASRRREVPKA